MLDNWERDFSPAVLGRGYDYFADGCVALLNPLEDGWRATVRGSLDYDVFVNVDLNASSCSCPYFADRGLCKHIAATCYEIEHQNDLGDSDDARKMPETDPIQLLETLDEHVRMAFLKEVLQEDEHWRDAFIRRFADVGFRELEHDFMEGVNAIVRDNAYDGFVDYRNAFRCEMELSRYVHDFIEPLMKRGDYSKAFGITTAFTICLQRIAIDDSDGFFAGMMDICTDVWERLFELHDSALLQEMFEWMSSFITYDEPEDKDENGVRWYLQESTEEFVAECFTRDGHFGDIDFAKDMLGLADQMLEKKACNQPFLPYQDDDYVSAATIRWVLARTRCMKPLGSTGAEIETYVLSYPANLKLIQPLVDGALSADDEQKAVALLVQYKQRLKEGAYSTDASLQLFELYRALDLADEAREELFGLAVHGSSQDDRQLAKWFRSLKGCCGDQWPDYENRLLEVLGENVRRLRVYYAATERYEELMESLEGATRYEIDHYRDLLASRYPDRYLSLYDASIREALKPSGLQRKHYHQQASLMMYMRTIPGGEEVVDKLVSDLRELYPRRRALLDELSRIG